MIGWALTAAGAVVGVGVLAFVAGSLLPRGHRSRVRARFTKPPELLFETITDFAAWPSWNPSVRKMERQADRNGKPVWLLTDANGKLPSCVELMRAPGRDQPGEIVTRIDDPKLPFGGTWTWRFALIDGGTEITITEEGEVKNPIFRLMSKLFFDPHGTAMKYLTALGKKHGDDVIPTPLR